VAVTVEIDPLDQQVQEPGLKPGLQLVDLAGIVLPANDGKIRGYPEIFVQEVVMSTGNAQSGLAGAADSVFRTAARASHDALSADPTGTRLPELVADAHGFVDKVVQAGVAASPADERPVCCVGCTACCYLHVVALPSEVLAIAKHIERAFSDEAREALRQRMKLHIDATQGLDADRRRQLRLPCPLLVEDRCSVYPVRPISCRGWNSLDRGLCDADLAEPSRGAVARLNLTQHVLAGRVAEGLTAASHALGLEHRRLDLVRGLQTALADLGAAERAWRSGTDVFGEAVNDEVFPGPDDPEENRARARLWSQLDPFPSSGQ